MRNIFFFKKGLRCCPQILARFPSVRQEWRFLTDEVMAAEKVSDLRKWKQVSSERATLIRSDSHCALSDEAPALLSSGLRAPIRRYTKEVGVERLIKRKMGSSPRYTTRALSLVTNLSTTDANVIFLTFEANPGLLNI